MKIKPLIGTHGKMPILIRDDDKKKIIIIRNTRYVVSSIQSVKVVQLFDRQIDQRFVSNSFNPVILALTKIISELQ
jgi:hypothetical protein